MTGRSTTVLLLLIAVCLAAGYGLRFGLMEDGQWVGVCSEQAQRWECQLRAALGWMIHFRVLAWVAVGLVFAGFFIQRKSGWWLAAAGLFCAIPALILYNASLAVFAVVVAGLRLVRRPPATA